MLSSGGCASKKTHWLKIGAIHWVKKFAFNLLHCFLTSSVILKPCIKTAYNVFNDDSQPQGWQDKQEGKQRRRQPVRQPIERERFTLCWSSSTTSQSRVSTETTGAISPSLLPKGREIIESECSMRPIITPNYPPTSPNCKAVWLPPGGTVHKQTAF